MKREPMGWEECNGEHMRRVDYDEDKVQSMLKLCRARLKVVEKIELDEETASYLFSIIGLKSIKLPLRERQGELPPTGMSLFQVFVRGFQRC